MKRILKLSMIISVILIMLLSNFCYATNAIMDTLTNEVDNKFTERALSEQYNSNDESDIMLISEDDEIMPINDAIEISSNSINSDAFQFEQNVSIESDINGNAYIIGKKVNISSEYINGNIFVIGEDVVINSNVAGSIYVMGKNVTLENCFVNTIYAIAENLTLSEYTNIMYDLNTTVKQLNLKCNVGRTLNAFVENIDIAQTSEYIENGNVTYSKECTGKTELLEAVNLVKNEIDEKEEESKKDETIGKIQSEIANIATAVAIIAILYLVIRNKETEKIDDYVKVFGNGILKGLLFLVVIPTIALILICTIFGIPLALLLITIYIIILCISVPVSSLKIGEMIYANNASSNKAIIILYASCVYVAIRLISLIPVIGGLIKFLIVLYGFGSLIGLIFGNRKSTSKEIVVNEE